jgi:hypothetical protein
MCGLPRENQPGKGPHRRMAALLPAMVFLFCAAPVPGDPLGMVSDNGSKLVVLFNADLDTVTASLDATPGRAIGDCALSSDESLGFSTSSSHEITFIEITREPAGPRGTGNRVPISNLGVDMALSPDETFLVMAGGGALQQPLSVIDTRLRAEVATVRPFVDQTSVEFCDNGTLLITTTHGKYFDATLDNALYDALIDRAGNISLNGHRIDSAAQPNNSSCAPGSLAGVLLDREGGLTSFTLPELQIAQRVKTRYSAPAVAATFSRDGKRLYVRTTETVEAFDFEPVTGFMSPDWVQTAPGSLAYYGMDQIALHPEGHKLYIDGGHAMLILDAGNGNRAGSIPLGDTTGICFANAPWTPGQDRIAQQSRLAEPPSR